LVFFYYYNNTPSFPQASSAILPPATFNSFLLPWTHGISKQQQEKKEEKGSRQHITSTSFFLQPSFSERDNYPKSARSFDGLAVK
jgi:hypothetical protein